MTIQNFWPDVAARFGLAKVLQRVAVCCSVLYFLTRTCLETVLQCVAVCCSVLQCVAVCCSVGRVP